VERAKFSADADFVSASPYMVVHFYYGASGAGVATKKFRVAGLASGWMAGRM